MVKRQKSSVSVTRGPNGGWVIDPPFKGGSYYEFKAWHHAALEARDEYLRLNGEPPSNVLALGVPDLDAVNWEALDPDDVTAFAAEAIDSYEAETLFTVTWEFDTPMNNGAATAYKIGNRYFADFEDGLFGPYISIDELFSQTEINKPSGSGTMYESTHFKAHDLAQLLNSERLAADDHILINGETWAVKAQNTFEPTCADGKS